MSGAPGTPAPRLERRTTLAAHASTPARGVAAVEARLIVEAARVALEYRIVAEPAALRWPAPESPGRRDGLWRHTCCELFVAPAAGHAYREFNFSPSGAWAAYAFTGRRDGMAPLELGAAPVIVALRDGDAFLLRVALAAADLAAAGSPAPLRIGLTAVIEDADGGHSYWAIAHPGARPDFHDPAGFTLALPTG